MNIQVIWLFWIPVITMWRLWTGSVSIFQNRPRSLLSAKHLSTSNLKSPRRRSERRPSSSTERLSPFAWRKWFRVNKALVPLLHLVRNQTYESDRPTEILFSPWEPWREKQRLEENMPPWLTGTQILHANERDPLLVSTAGSIPLHILWGTSTRLTGPMKWLLYSTHSVQSYFWNALKQPRQFSNNIFNMTFIKILKTSADFTVRLKVQATKITAFSSPALRPDSN